MPTIFILSGPAHSGKTTRLINWIKNNNGIAGIVAPKINSLRYLQDIAGGEKRRLETHHADNADAVKVGQYVFSGRVFRWAVEVIQMAIVRKPDWLIIDEIGPLELSGKGLASAVNSVLQCVSETNIVLVIRENLVNDVINYYNLDRENIKEFKF